MTPHYRPPRDPDDIALRIICGLLIVASLILSAYEILATVNLWKDTTP